MSTDSSRAAFFQAIRQLYGQAGAPSSRTLATRIGLGQSNATPSHTSVNNIITAQVWPRWESVASLVTALDGDPEDFRPLWLAGSGLAPEDHVIRTAPAQLFAIIVDNEIQSIVTADEGLAKRRAEAAHGLVAKWTVVADYRV